MNDPWDPIDLIVEKIKSKQTSAIETVNKAFTNIDRTKDYNTTIVLFKDLAIQKAKSIDDKISHNLPVGKLAGVPYFAKDNFLVFGGDTTAASNMLKGFKAPYQASVINKLDIEDAICIGKTNLDAFAHGASTENSDFMITKNPYDKTRVPGGSSGGSAAAVALNQAPFALGTDTGGSIRQPASFCGVVGYKPTYGLVSRSGVVAMGSSLDCIGPITSRVSDASIVMDIISGKDPLDATTIDLDPLGYKVTPSSLKGLKVGVISEYLGDGVSSEVKTKIKQTLEQLTLLGAKVENVSLPSLPLALACYYIITPAEVSSNLSRYDGQKYGFNYEESKDLEESYTKSRGNGFGSEAKRRIMIGTYVLSSGYYDAYYKKAQTIRTKLINEFNKAFMGHDVLVGPVAPTTAFKIGSHNHNPMEMYLSDVMTVAANLVGVPSISLPVGMGSSKLPIGFQVMANQRQDRRLLGIALAIESGLKQ